MPSLNKTFLMGHLARDPELRVTPKGTQVCQFAIGINREWKTESGEKQSEVTFVDIEAWGRTAETISKYFVKGRPIFVEGRLKQDLWEDKNTHEKRSRIKIVLENFQFVGGDRNAEPNDKPAQAPQNPEPKQASLDEDVPF